MTRASHDEFPSERPDLRVHHFKSHGGDGVDVGPIVGVGLRHELPPPGDGTRLPRQRGSWAAADGGDGRAARVATGGEVSTRGPNEDPSSTPHHPPVHEPNR